MKMCSDCRTIKSFDEFHKDSSTHDGLYSLCKVCKSIKGKIHSMLPEVVLSRRQRKLKNLYGITIEQYNEMFETQNGCCSICTKHQSEFKRALAVDHDHQTLQIRGLLCGKCNKFLGHYELRVKEGLLEKFPAYLQATRPKLVRIA